MLKRTIGVIAAAGLVVGCNQSEPGKPAAQSTSPSGTINVSKIVRDQTISTGAKAEQLAKAAEQLLSAQGFAYANDVADLALQQDATNLRAQWVKAFLAPVLAEKGILTRIAPLAQSDATLTSKYADLMASVQVNVPNSTLKSFALEGQGDIKTEADLQAHLDTVAAGFEALRQFAKNNKDRSIVLNATDTFYGVLMKRWQDACTVSREVIWYDDNDEPWGGYSYQISCPSTVNVMEVTMDRADFESIEELAAGYELYLSLHNSYDLSGALATLSETQSNPVSTSKVLQELFKNPKFATLRATNGFQKIRDMGADAIVGLRWALEHQGTLCPVGTTDPHNRPGALINEGICFYSALEVAKAVNLAESTLAGANLKVINSYGQSVLLHPLAWIDTPLADLRPLTPLTFDACNQVAGTADPTLGGLFPNGDGNVYLQSMANPCDWPL